MTTNNRIKVSDLDYNQIRENLKTFMRGQSEFSDYDFEGSALSTLIDLLAYNTHYNALYTNLAINEMFLDSASKRSSVVSIANNFGYTPESCLAARAKLNLTVSIPVSTANPPQIKYIPRLSSFTTTIDKVPYTFYTLQDYAAERNGLTYSFNGIEIYQGTPQTLLFVCTEPYQKFILNNSNIDISTLTITVQPTGEQPDYERYERAMDVLQLTPSSKIYYVKELDDGTYQISFGSNDLGIPIQTGNVITAQFMITNKAAGNGAKVFTYTGTGLGGGIAIELTSTSYGGRDAETVDQIRSNVSHSFFNQNRAVTTGDYTALLKKLYPNLDSISVWGGEDNDPPQYGKVFLSLKPTNGPYLTPPEKSYITESLLKSRNIVSITPEILDPSYLDLDITTSIYYDKNKTTRSMDEIKNAVLISIQNYRNNNLRKFDGIFRMSKFSAAIDAADQSILSNITTFKVYCEVIPKYNIAAEYRLNIVNPIYNENVPEEAFQSTGFYLDNSDTVYYMDDDGFGNVRVYSIVEGTGNKIIQNPKIGTIDYANGVIKISGLKIVNLLDANFYFIIKTQSFDVVSLRNYIVNIPDSRININVIPDTSLSGVATTANNYTFTSSRN
jgi:hypothetical protein